MATRQQRPIPLLFWRLYIVLGAFSTAIGLFALCNPGFFFPARGLEHTLIRVVGGVFVVFGVARIVNAIVQIKQLLSRKPTSAPKGRSETDAG
jgi:hypothetical protein